MPIIEDPTVGGPPQPDLNDPQQQTNARLAHADPTFDPNDTLNKIAQVEAAGQSTLPSDMTVALAQQPIPPDELHKASVLIARSLDFMPTFLLTQHGFKATTGRPGFGDRLYEFTDPVSGGMLSFSSARRLLKPYQVPVMESMLKSVFNTRSPEQFATQLVNTPEGGDIPKLRMIDSGQPPTPARVSAAVAALAPLQGDTFDWSKALGAAIQIARTDVNLPLLTRNLDMSRQIPNITPTEAIAIALQYTLQSQTSASALSALHFPIQSTAFRDVNDAMIWAIDQRHPEAQKAFEQASAMLEQRAQLKNAQQPVDNSMFGPSVRDVAQQAVSHDALQRQPEAVQLAAGFLSGDVQQTAADFDKMAALVAKQARIHQDQFHNTFLYKSVTTALRGLNTAYNYMAANFFYGQHLLASPDNLAVSGGLTPGDRPNIQKSLADAFDTQALIRKGQATIGSAYQQEMHLPQWTSPLLDLGFSFLLDPTIIAGKIVSMSRAGNLLFELAKGGGTAAEDIAPKVIDTWTQPMRALRFSHLGSGRTIGEYLAHTFWNAKDSESAWLSAVSRFRGWRQTEGIDRTFAAHLFDVTGQLKKAGFSEQYVAGMISQAGMEAMGVNVGGISHAFDMERAAIDAALKQRSIDALDAAYQHVGGGPIADQLAAEMAASAKGLELTHDESWLLATMDQLETPLITGPRIMHEIPHLNPISDLFRAIKDTGLADSRVGGGMSAAFNKTPRALWDLEGLDGPSLPEQFSVRLRRARGLFTQSEQAAYRMSASRILDMEIGTRESSFMALVRRFDRDVAEKELARAFRNSGAPEGNKIVEGLLNLSERTNDLLAKSQVFGTISNTEMESIDRLNAEVAGLPGEKTIFTQPIASTQYMNKMAGIDPLVVRRALYGNTFSLTRMGNSIRRVFGKDVVMTDLLKSLETGDLAALPTSTTDAMGIDRLYSGWKALVVTRPAYVTRVVWLDENLRYAATLGWMAHISDTRSGAALLSAWDRVTGRPREVTIETPDGPKSILFGRPGRKLSARQIEKGYADLSYVDPAALVGTKNRALFETLGNEQKRLMEDMGGSPSFDALPRSAANFLPEWSKDLNDQLGRAPEFGPILRAVMEGRPAQEGADEAVQMMLHDSRYAQFRKDQEIDLHPETWANRAARLVTEYTGNDPEIARAALQHVVDPDVLRTLPEERWPSHVHGAELSLIKGNQGWPSRLWSTYRRWILEKPTDVMNRGPYFRDWNAALKESMIRQAALSNRVLATPEEITNMVARERELAAAVGKASRDPFAELRRQEGIYFHGTKEDIKVPAVIQAGKTPRPGTAMDLQPLQYGDPQALVGPGAYFTEDAGVAGGVGKGPGYAGPGGKVFAVRLNPDAKLLDLEKTLTPDLADVFQRRAMQIYGVEPTAAEADFTGLTGMEAMKKFRGLLRESDQPLYEAHADLLSLQEGLREVGGYDGVTHIGGKITGTAAHKVVVLWDTGEKVRPMEGLITHLATIRRLPAGNAEALRTALEDTQGKLSRVISMDAIDRESEKFARGQVRRIMFDMRDQGRLGEMLRFVIPFFQPWAEAFTVWGRILQENPAIAGYAYEAIKNGLSSGFIHKDKVTGQLEIPMSNWMGIAPLLSHFLHVPGWQLSSSLAGFNLFFNNTVPLPTGAFAGNLPIPFPGFSPPVQVFLQNLAENNALPMSARLWLSSWVFQNGVSSASPGPGMTATGPGLAASIASNVLPRWMVYLGDSLGIVTNPAQVKDWADNFLKTMEMQGLTPYGPKDANGNDTASPHAPPGFTQDEYLNLPPAERIQLWQRTLSKMAYAHAKTFGIFRGVMSLTFPSAAKVDFPIAQYQDELDRDRTKLGYRKGNAKFLADHSDQPGLQMMVIANSMWNDQGGQSPISITPNQATERIMSMPYFQHFAQTEPAWAWAIIPSEARNAKFDINTYSAFLAADIFTMRGPEDLQVEGDRQAGWNAYFPAVNQHNQTVDKLLAKGEGPGNAEFDAEAVRWKNWISDTEQVHPDWGADYENFTASGISPVSLASARAAMNNPVFAKTQTAAWLRGYLPEVTDIMHEMSAHGIHTLDTKAAQALGLPKRYNDMVNALNKEYPDGKIAFQTFFSGALTAPETDYEKSISKLSAEKLAVVGQFQAQYKAALNAPSFTDPGPDKMQAFLDIKTMSDEAFTKNAAGLNPMLLWWHSRSGMEKQTYYQNLMGRPYEFLSRFDREVVLKEPTSDQAEAAWLQVAHDQITIAKFRKADPLAPAGPIYAALAADVAKLAANDPVFRTQVQHANQWGYSVGKVLDQTFGKSGTAPQWQSFLDDLHTVQVAMDTPFGISPTTGLPEYLHGPDFDIDPRRKAMWQAVKGALINERDRLFQQSPQFQREWNRLENLNGYTSLIDYLMPTGYYPVGGYTLAPGASGGP